MCRRSKLSRQSHNNISTFIRPIGQNKALIIIIIILFIIIILIITVILIIMIY
jgi:hypothetical protein